MERFAAYRDLDDPTLARLAQGGDRSAEAYLLFRHRTLVKQRIMAYYLVGAEREDLFQEGMIGLSKAIRDYDPTKAASFRHFAALCILRQILTAIKTANRQKHLPLGSYLPLSGDEEAPFEIPVGGDLDEQLFQREGIEWIKSALFQHLSGFEWQVFVLYLKGHSYEEISAALHRSTKAIDNALTRIREKGKGLRLQMLG